MNQLELYIDGLVLDCNNSSALATEILQFCPKPSICNRDKIKHTQTVCLFGHCSDVTWAFWSLKSSADIKENINDAHYWPFVKGIHRWPMDSHHKGSLMRKTFLCHNVTTHGCVNNGGTAVWTIGHGCVQVPGCVEGHRDTIDSLCNLRQAVTSV